MVLAINAPATGNTFDAFLANAKGTASASTTASASGTQAITSSTATQANNPGSNGASRGTSKTSLFLVVMAVVLGSLL